MYFARRPLFHTIKIVAVIPIRIRRLGGSGLN
jgi:hypothetical protein